jgi:hypothetical protein
MLRRARTVSTVLTFVAMRTVSDVYWLMPILGFFAWGLLGGYAIYFPELFPTRLRSTDTGFCYNGARYLTVFGLVGLGQLVLGYQSLGWTEPLRPAAVTIASVYALGLVTLFWAPETRKRPLPE